MIVAMSASSIYLKHEITIKDLRERESSSARLNMSQKWLFVGIDLAPIDSLETGISVIDRDRRIVRMEKMNDDDQLLQFIDRLSPVDNIIVALDIPKSLNIVSKWRQQQIKMHPGRVSIPAFGDFIEPGSVPSERFAQRAKDFYDALESRGILTVGFFAAHAKLRYSLNIPFRSRSPQGCRALQAALRQRLQIKDVPTNLAPSSVLDAMVGAYTAWLFCYGREAEHFKLYEDDEDRLYLDPLKRPRVASKRRS